MSIFYRCAMKLIFKFLLVTLFIGEIKAEDTQLPKPESESVKQAVEDIREAYAEDYKDAEQGTRNKHNLALKLTSAAEEENDAAVQFALFKEAIRLLADAQQAGDLIKTTDDMAERFKIDDLKIKVYFLKKIAGETKRRSSDRHNLNAMQIVTDQAIARDQYDKALEILAAVISMGERTKDRKLLREYETIIDVTRQEAQQFQAVQDARQVLDEKPLDATANQTVGEWYCLKKNRWDEGVTYLALGEQAEMKALSRLDLKPEKNSDDLVRVGNLCWQLAEERPDNATAFKNRAVFWYQQVQPLLSGVTKKKIGNRIASWQSENEDAPAEAEPKKSPKEEQEPLLAKRPKPLGKVKPLRWDAPKNLAGTSLLSRNGRVVMRAGQPMIQVAGKNDIYLHPYRDPGRSVLVYDLDGRYRSLTGAAGVPEIPGMPRPESEITFSVIRDGKTTEISRTSSRGKRSFEPFELDVTGVKQLVLSTQCRGNFLGCFAFWFNPVLSPEPVRSLD
tara:strand:- start:22 stop:1536 length:1515 start_codon:yes stop_codon:yes gene_type:complete